MKLFSDKFNYDVSESAPQGYVMRVMTGSLGTDDDSVMVPSLANSANGWGASRSAATQYTATALVNAGVSDPDEI